MDQMRHYSARKRSLVTGGAGSLCSRLIARLISRGGEMLCEDNS